MESDLEMLVRTHFENAQAIQTIQEEQKDVTRQTFRKIMEKGAEEFVTINWKALHRAFFPSKM